MAYGLKLRGETYYSNLVIPGTGGKLHVEALSKDLAEAKRLRDKIVESLELRRPRTLAGRISSEMSIEAFTEKALARYQKKKPGTFRIVLRAMRKLVEALPIKTVADITPAALEALRASWIKIGHIKVDKHGNPVGKENIAGANREIRAIVAVMRWAEDDPEIGLPIQNWRRVIKGQWHELKNRTLFYTPAQHQKLRQDASGGQALSLMLTLYMLAYRAGLRCGEIRHLRREDIDFENRRIYIRAKTWKDLLTGQLQSWAPKGSNPKRTMERAVPMDAELYAYLKAWLAHIPGDWVMSEDLGMPFQENSFTHQWARIIKGTKEKPGLGIGSIHTLRHCFATGWISRGEPLENVQRFLGHSHITTTQEIYNHFVPTQFATAAR